MAISGSARSSVWTWVFTWASGHLPGTFTQAATFATTCGHEGNILIHRHGGSGTLQEFLVSRKQIGAGTQILLPISPCFLWGEAASAVRLRLRRWGGWAAPPFTDRPPAFRWAHPTGRGARGGRGLLATLKGPGGQRREKCVPEETEESWGGWTGGNSQEGPPPAQAKEQGDGERLGVSQSARGTLGPEWRDLQARRETGGGAGKCGCKGGELTDPGKAHTLGRPLSVALSFLWTEAVPLQGSAEGPAWGGGTASPLLPSWLVGSPLHSPSLPRPPAVGLCSCWGLWEPLKPGRPRLKCQALLWHTTWMVIRATSPGAAETHREGRV